MRKSIRIHRRSGPRPGSRGRRLALAALAALAVAPAGCMYGFEGGGFPPHIRTIYIAPFENQTAQFDIEQALFSRLIDELPAKLGLRTAGREAADAILTGQIRRYDDAAQNYQAGGAAQTTNVLSHQVQVGISAQLVDVRDNVIRWEATSLTGRGQYRPDAESDDVGLRQAIDNIIEQIIDGAQSQW